ncbi:aminotransferase class I/II-fold pyridoxal phosphate-dependent enzyme [Stenotrophomonas sp. SORGH_AS_0321]|uniref:pyridoxal phosphate-dependent aminotransferase n=1 Tax=Stenotrophomonas sp. SORGH_AS_0321 TaxID=3041787 RepID=UPI00285C78C3|nr:aminotransferase class I/II-fold pyridoxal phosphate-dependent enzyme [Stenotrophomonas sp. SORGH_AS_0321]MDR6094833.1 histidinol-phosphate aminotransferase [Stenotrophomonas sp. SORGH_AS_0321]
MLEKKAIIVRQGFGTYSMPDNDFPNHVKLHLNENMFSSALHARGEVAGTTGNTGLASLHMYPIRGTSKLQEAIAEQLTCSPANVLITNGSAELLRLLFTSITSEGDSILLPSPSWSFFTSIAQLSGARARYYQLAKGPSTYEYDLGDLRSGLATYAPKLAVICSPNNPTGNAVEARDLLEVIDQFPAVTFLVDQAYHGFSDQERGADLIVSAAITSKNLLVTRTFSKFLALANLRIGFLVGNADIVECVRPLATVFGISTLSQELAIERIQDHRLQNDLRSEYEVVREYVNRKLLSIEGLYPYKTEANFILVRCAPHWNDLAKNLMDAGFMVKSENIGESDTHLRITLADLNTMKSLLQTIESIGTSSS